MRMLSTWILLFPLLTLLGGTAAAVEEKRADKPAVPVSDKARDAAIAAGLGYLDRTVFALPDASGTPRKQFTVAVTGLAWLLAQDGQSKTKRQGGRAIDKARKYLGAYVSATAKRVANPTQLPETTGSFSSNHAIQYTWPLAMAGLFYGELNARGRGSATGKQTLRALVDLLVRAQAPNGGWGHGQVRGRGKPRGKHVMDGFGGYPDTLLASSNLVATALAVLKPIAPPAKADTLKRALAYFEYAELNNGNFPYDPSQRSSQRSMTGVSRAAGAALAMRTLGVGWDDAGMSRALAFIDEHFAYLSEGHGSSTYNLLLAALLQKQRGKKHWARFKRVFFPRMVAAQEKSGSFVCICENKAFGSSNDSKPMGGVSTGIPDFLRKGTEAYVTSIHTLILLLDRTNPRIVPKADDAPTPKPTITPR